MKFGCSTLMPTRSD